MVYQREGYPHGAWEISLDGHSAILEAQGAHSFPELDRFYKPAPRIAAPRTWDDYEDELVDGAEDAFLAWIRAKI